MRWKCPYYCSFSSFYSIKPSWLECQANSEGINLVMLLFNLLEMWLIWNRAGPSFEINDHLFIALKQTKCVQSNCNCIMESMPQSTKWILPICYHNYNTRDLWMIGLCPSSNWSDQNTTHPSHLPWHGHLSETLIIAFNVFHKLPNWSIAKESNNIDCTSFILKVKLYLLFHQLILF